MLIAAKESVAAQEVNAAERAPIVVDPDNPAVGRRIGAPIARKVVYALCVALSLFQLYTAAFTPLSSLVVRSVHVGVLMAIAFALIGVSRFEERRTVPWFDWLAIAASLAVGLYHWLFESDILSRVANPSTIDLAFAALAVVLLVEASRRVMGMALPLMCIACVPFALLGPHLPSFMAHRGFDIEQVLEQLYLGSEGILGIPVMVSASYIYLFILFGAFLEHAGIIQLFNDLAMGVVGRARGGPAKVAIVSSGLMGTINGSGIANVVSTGQFTIPLMIRYGYRPHFSGAVEATASMGGQLMPPVMGAAAFLMAETLGVPYYEVAIAALLPALLYYAGLFWMVHLQACKDGLEGLPRELCQSPLTILRRKWFLILPLVALVYLLFAGYTPMFAGAMGLSLTIILLLGQHLATVLNNGLGRIVFWLLVGALATALVPMGIGAVLSLVLSLALIVLVTRGGKALLRLCLDSMADAAVSALGVGLACAVVGIMLGIITLSGIGTTMAREILSLAGTSFFMALILTMIVCLILGTGLPTLPTYIITSAMMAPALLKMGVPLIASHMFCFYFGIVADLTPPVALAAMAASPIAKAGQQRIAWTATMIGIPGYIMPFIMVYSPELLMQGNDPLAIAYVAGKAALAIFLWGIAAMGYWLRPMSWMERGGATIAAGLFVTAQPLTDELGFALAAIFVAYHYLRKRNPQGSLLRQATDGDTVS